MASNARTRTLFAIQTTGASPQTLSSEQFHEMVSAGRIHARRSRDGRTFLSTDRVTWYPVRLITIANANAVDPDNGPDVNNEPAQAEDPEDPQETDETNEFDEMDEMDEMDDMDEMDEAENSDEDEDDTEDFPQGFASWEEVRQHVEARPMATLDDVMMRAFAMHLAERENSSGIGGAMVQGGAGNSADVELEGDVDSSDESEDGFKEKSEWSDWDREPETNFWQRNQYRGTKASLGFR